MTKDRIAQCIVDGCLKNRGAGRRYCETHYYRLRSYGSTDECFGSTVFLRFWRQVAITADDTKCWLWQGTQSKLGYGRFGYNNGVKSAHRMAWFLTYGEFSKEFILHTCDTPLCVNPKHLMEGSHQDNMRQMMERNRSRKGSALSCARLDEDKVRQIHILLAQGWLQKSIATWFDVGDNAINDINTGRTWKHVT